MSRLNPQLRKWQELALRKALKQYSDGISHFMCVAAPGAGKTRYSAALAHYLFQNDDIDFVLCFAPSVTVANGIKDTFSSVLNDAFDGRFGSKGQVVTYQGLQHQYTELAQLIKNYRVLIVSDEIHHCAYGANSMANQWGQIIGSLTSLGNPLTLSLSGTPWRSNGTKIALQNYIGEPEELHTDFIYGLGDAVSDKVCRKPTLILLDNHAIKVREQGKTHNYQNIQNAIESGKLKYNDLLLQKASLNQLILHAQKQLREVKETTPTAAGLVVASSVAQAKRITEILSKKYRQKVVLVSYEQTNAHEKIREFQNSENDWIVSVGMVSEGTDIPRLQVCAYLSNVKTEIYFRQVLGRILRINQSPDEPCYLFAFAEPRLLEFSQRISDDLPAESMMIRVAEELASDVRGIPDYNYENNIENQAPVFELANSSNPENAKVTNWSEPLKPVQPIFCRSSYRSLILSL